MSISVSPLDHKSVLVETPNGSIIYQNGEPMAVKIDRCILTANSAIPYMDGVISTVIIPQSEINNLVRSL